MPGFEAFDRWVVENDIPDKGRPEGLACWLSGQKGSGRAVRFEKVEPGHEQILEDHEQRELDALPSGLDRDREN